MIIFGIDAALCAIFVPAKAGTHCTPDPSMKQVVMLTAQCLGPAMDPRLRGDVRFLGPAMDPRLRGDMVP